MNTCLYLDTARLGPMCPEAQRADRDFARLAGEEAGSLYYDLFLSCGAFSLPTLLRRRYPALSSWSGTAALKRRVLAALAMRSHRPMLLANRTAQLVRLACHVLCQRCENILVTDMLWPAYRKILEAELRHTGRRLTTVSVRAAILDHCTTKAELVDQLVGRYRQEDCDGLFLSAVTCHGVRMPVAEISGAVSHVRRPRFFVLDAAQALNHVPMGPTADYVDFMIAGSHKWLRAYHPMGLGFCCRRAADRALANALADMLERGELDDPLLRFSYQLETDSCEPLSETVNVAPLFTTTAAVDRIWCSERSRREELSLQLANTDRAAAVADGSPWRPVRPLAPMRCGILLFQAKTPQTQHASPDALRQAFRSRGVALSAYQGGLIRTSFPPDVLPTAALSQFRRALRSCA